jgi:RimJ/RimL family protein N-acetyltransferase
MHCQAYGVRSRLAVMKLVLERTEHPAYILTGFYHAWERARPGLMKAAYGWSSPSSYRDSAELMLIAYLEEAPGHLLPIGWASLLPHPSIEDCRYLAIGIMPEYTGKGYRKPLLMAASDWAFKCLDCVMVTAEVFDTNAAQQSKYMQDSRDPSWPFRYSGSVWYPKGMALKQFTRVK